MDDGHQVNYDHLMNHMDPSMIPPFLHTLQGGLIPKSILHGVYAPLWQYSPPPTSAHHVNLELLSTFEWFMSLTQQVQFAQHPILSQPINFMTALLPSPSQSSWEVEEEEAAVLKEEEDTLHSILLYPIFESFAKDAMI